MRILKQYIPTGARHKLLFTSHHAEGMNFVDIGALLARAIESSLSNRHLSFVAEEELEKIIKANVCHSSEIGDYIAIRNIGILFEPALRLDLHAKFSTWSKVRTSLRFLYSPTVIFAVFILITLYMLFMNIFYIHNHKEIHFH